uniref:Uncharacterized protein n=1 Tax=Rhizophora mucronata TaxID=61149 RepID=A0A2P2PXT6_RHIMU
MFKSCTRNDHISLTSPRQLSCDYMASKIKFLYFPSSC